MLKLENKIRITINGVYFFCVLCVLILASYSIYSYYAFWEGLWHGSYISLWIPFIFNTYVAVALGVGAIPMVLLCLAVYKNNNIARNKHRILKGFLIWLPACICLLSLLVLLHEVLITNTLHFF